jgi:hypothetical protein
MADQPTITEVVAEDHYWSETLKQEVYSFRCPVCQVVGVVTQVDDVNQCECGAFLRVVAR